MTETFQLASGILHRISDSGLAVVTNCPYTSRDKPCGTWCPHFRLTENATVLYCGGQLNRIPLAESDNSIGEEVTEEYRTGVLNALQGNSQGPITNPAGGGE